MWKKDSVASIFFKGLFTALPITITLYAFYWLGSGAETTMERVYTFLLPKATYYPGVGVALGVVLVFALGVLMNIWLFRRLVQRTEEMLGRIPLVKTIYIGIQDMLGFFSGGGKKLGGRVVAVEFNGFRIIGFVTREDCSDLPPELAPPGSVAVFVPVSYQIGGYTFYVPKEKLIPIDLGLEEAMRLAVTAGVGGNKGAETGEENAVEAV